MAGKTKELRWLKKSSGMACMLIVAASLLTGLSHSSSGKATAADKPEFTATADDYAMIVGSEVYDYAMFGASASVFGNTMVIGAPGFSHDASSPGYIGKVYVYEKSATGTWEEKQILKLEDDVDPNGDNFFGYSVHISGNRLIVGAYLAPNHEHTLTGQAYIYERDATGTWELDAVLSPDGLELMDLFGVRVAISNDSAVVVAALTQHDGTWSKGTIYFYKKDGSTWSLIKTLTPESFPGNIYYGYDIALSRDTLVLSGNSMTSDPQTNFVDVHYRNKGGEDNWGKVTRLKPEVVFPLYHAGSSIAISGDTIVMNGYDGEGGTGYFFVFDRNQGGKDAWGQVRSRSNPEGVTGFAGSLAISGDVILAGASEKVLAYQRDFNGPNNWGLFGHLQKPANADRFGSAIAISNANAVIGAEWTDHLNGSAYAISKAFVGNLKVKITPQEAVAAGAGWRIDGTGDWRASGNTASGLLIGGHNVSFRKLDGWKAVPGRKTTVFTDINTVLNVNYVKEGEPEEDGKLRVLIKPLEARKAGAMWTYSGTDDVYKHRATVLMAPGTINRIKGTRIKGWTTPVVSDVIIEAGKKTTVVLTYEK